MRFLGWDDWLMFARADDGRLICRVYECDSRWLDAPHQGEAEYDTDAWREDNAYMLQRIRTEDTDPAAWTDDKHGLAVSDEEFVRRSTESYLPRKEKQVEEWCTTTEVKRTYKIPVGKLLEKLGIAPGTRYWVEFVPYRDGSGDDARLKLIVSDR